MPHSDDLSQLSTILNASQQRIIPAQLLSAKPQVEAVYRAFQDVMAQKDPPLLYGVNTLPGHREGLTMPEGYLSRYQSDLIENHCLPQTRFFDPEIGTYIHFAKCCSLTQGRSLISPELYDFLLDLAEDGNFQPAVPREASYSSGDVIPGAFWARAVLKARPAYQLKLGEGMALINGAFVHVGAMLGTMKPLDEVWRSYLINTRTLFGFLSANESFVDGQSSGDGGIYRAALTYVTEESRLPHNDDLQPAVSCRAIPQVLDALLKAILNTAKETEACLFQPSGNPLIRATNSGETYILPSGSFVIPSLALAAGQLLDALLMTGWNIVRRMEYFLSGNVANIPLDAASEANPIGLIQWPKLAAAKLERMRILYNRRIFASGAVTSYGVEDFGTNGTLMAEQLLDSLGDLKQILEFEHLVLKSVGSADHPDLKTCSAELAVAANKLSEEICLF